MFISVTGGYGPSFFRAKQTDAGRVAEGFAQPMAALSRAPRFPPAEGAVSTDPLRGALSRAPRP
jgi:hypothetical protein